MMSSKLELAKEALAQKDFKKLDDLWTEIIIDKQISLNAIFELTSELKKQAASDQAIYLLEITAAHWESENEYRKVIEVYKNILQFKKEDGGIRKELVNLYGKLYADRKYITDYIEISGLDKSEPIYKALEKLEEFLRFDIGNCFYFERYGIGEIIDVVPTKKEIIIDFENKPRHFLTFDVAKGLLQPIGKDHFLYQKYKHLAELKQLSLANPLELVKSILKSFVQPVSVSQIKIHLDGILQKEEINTWWEKVRKLLEKDKNIRISGKTLKTYAYVAAGVNKDEDAIALFERTSARERYLLAEEYAKKMPAVFRHILPQLIDLGNKIYEAEPALALDILFLCDDVKIDLRPLYNIETILTKVTPEQILLGLNNLDHQKRLLAIIKEKNPDHWQDVFSALLLKINNFKLLDLIVLNLENGQDKSTNMYNTILSMPKQYPEHYQWLLKKMQGNLLNEYLTPSLIPRLIDSLEYIKGIRPVVQKILSLKNFEELLKKAADDEAKRIIDAINRSQGLAHFEKKDFFKIIEHYFPRYFEKEIDIIYSTEPALSKKREELKRLITIEIPENKKDIGRAREFGDLSENSEYKVAKERQDQLYQKIKELEENLQKVVIIDPKKTDISRVEVGTKVTLKNLQNNEIVDYTILGRWDTDLTKNIISNEAPVAKALLGKACAEQVMINNAEYEIVSIEKTP